MALITRSALAREIGYSRMTLLRWEAAGVIPTPVRRGASKAFYSMASAEAIRSFARAAA